MLYRPYRMLLFVALAVLVSACGTMADGPKDLAQMVIQADELPAGHLLTESGYSADGQTYEVTFVAGGGRKTIVASVTKFESKSAAFDFVTSERKRFEADDYFTERAKDLGDLNYSLSRLGDVNEYVMLFADGSYAARIQITGPGVIFGDIYVVARYIYRHLDPDQPTPRVNDQFSEERS